VLSPLAFLHANILLAFDAVRSIPNNSESWCLTVLEHSNYYGLLFFYVLNIPLFINNLRHHKDARLGNKAYRASTWLNLISHEHLNVSTMSLEKAHICPLSEVRVVLSTILHMTYSITKTRRALCFSRFRQSITMLDNWHLSVNSVEQCQR
jgi:hypothetical protein